MGLAGAAGVVATGVVVVRAERRRRAYTPEQVREQLHMRLAQAESAQAESAQAESAQEVVEVAGSAPGDRPDIRARIRRILRR